MKSVDIRDKYRGEYSKSREKITKCKNQTESSIKKGKK